MRYHHYYVVAALLVAATACSGGGGGGSGKEETAAPAATSGTSSGTAPGNTDAANTPAPSSTTTEIAAAPVPTPAAIPVSDVPSTPPTQAPAPAPAPDAPPPVPEPAKPVAMTLSIVSPQNGASLKLTASPQLLVYLKAESNKADAQYQWKAKGPDDIDMTVKQWGNGDLTFAPTVAGAYSISLSGASTDGTSATASSTIQVTDAPDPSNFAAIYGMTDQGSYAMGSYKLNGMNYAQYQDSPYFSCQWSVIQKPEGSVAAITDGANCFGAVFSPDKEGSYGISVVMANGAGSTATKGITVKILKSVLSNVWTGFVGTDAPNVVKWVSNTEMYVGTNVALFRYNGKQWLPILVDNIGKTPVYSLFRNSASELVVGSTGKLLQYDGANWTTIALPPASATHKVVGVDGFSSQFGIEVWAVTAEGELFNLAGGTLSLSGSSTSSYDTVIAFPSGYVYPLRPVYVDPYWQHMISCAHLTTEDPIFCLAKDGKVYGMMPPDNLKLTLSEKYNPLPTGTPIGIAAQATEGGGVDLSIVDQKGLIWTYPAQVGQWIAWPGMTTVLLDPKFAADLHFGTSLLGGQGAIYRLGTDQKTWGKESLPAGFTPRRFYRVPDGNLYIAGSFEVGGLVVVDPAKKQVNRYEKIGGQEVMNLWGPKDSNLWAITKDAKLFHYDGQKWSEMSGPAEVTLDIRALGGSFDGKTLYMKGSQNIGVGQFLKTTDGIAFLTMPSNVPPSEIFRFLTIDAATTYAFGTDSSKHVPYVWKLDGDGTWKGQALPGNFAPFSVNISDAHAASATDITAVGSKGTLFHYDGTKWAQEPTDVTDDIVSVHGADKQTWAMTDSGKVLQRDAATGSWKTIMALPKDPIGMLLSIHFLDSNNYFYGGVIDLNFVGVKNN